MKNRKINLKNFSAGRKALGKRILVYIGSAVAAAQVVQLLVEGIQHFINPKMLPDGFIIPYYNTLSSAALVIPAVIVAVILAFIKQLNYSSYSNKIKNTNITINLEVGDILTSKDDTIIPCNNIFAYNLDIIGNKSIQAQLTKSIKCKGMSGEEFIGQQVDKALNTQEFKDARLMDEPQIFDGKKYHHYPYGLILPIKHSKKKKDKKFYLLAMSSIVDKGKPTVDHDTLIKSIDSMFGNIQKNKLTGENLAMPVMGTGAAKMLEKPKQIVARYILKRFAQTASTSCIKNLTLYIYPDDYLKDEIDIEELRDYIDFLCRYPENE